ncbi:CRISPR-associated protein, Cse1 family [Streptomyces sp. TLI_053]|uniref:type I-E CRISPR-associated protein Cse1/CasA n=1 Tax=Streptomyces sp. TLI_053 TaxID=1855352 RepID=UPI0008797206|nr:type I-E CRISPR-associated protein Cse1/CasA [Streptomyces sp. TLI_053]SDS49956.1 CRISPR-associated protein, Cse1 family [Streptomyces sp. TLI_053]
MSSTAAPDPPSFSVADRPWIPVRTRTAYEHVGLRELLLRAHEFDDLAFAIPPVASAVLRVASAIAARICALDDTDLSASRWNRLRRDLLENTDRFDPKEVHAYFDRHEHRLDAFHPERPWLQDPRLAHQSDPAGINTLVLGRATGNNFAWFGPHTDAAPHPLPTAEAVQHLLLHHFYGRSGAAKPRTVGTYRNNKLTSAPLRGTVSFHPLGRTLYETLLAGIPAFHGDYHPAVDLSPWEEEDLPDPMAPPAPVTWPGRLLTGRSRHALLLVPGPDGTTVTDAHLAWATRHPKPTALDPYVVLQLNPTAKDPEKRCTARRADTGRAWWRELEALLLAPDESARTRRPQVFDTLNDLPATVRDTLRVRVHGFHQDHQCVDYGWYTALTPPLLAWAQENDPGRAQRIADCCRTAEDIAHALTRAANQAWKDTTTPPGANRSSRPARRSRWAERAGAAYWPLAEKTFWRLLHDTDHPVGPAFAHDAITALRQATDSAVIQHRAAARARTTATTTLRLAGARLPKGS